MSETVDRERREQARRDELERQIEVVSHTLRVLIARREGQTVPVIADTTGKSPRTIDNRIAFARALLRRVESRKSEER